MTMQRILAASKMLIATLVVSAVGFASIQVAHAESLLEKARKQGFIRIAFTNEDPFSYVTAAGKLEGEDIDIARVVLKKMGIDDVDGVLTEWGSLIPALKSNRVDMIAAGFFVTPKRCAEVTFSEPVFGIGEAFLVKKGNPKNLTKFEDFVTNKTANIGVLSGAAEGDYAKAAGIAASQIQAYPDFPTELAALNSGRIDAAAMVAVTAEQEMKKEGANSAFERTPAIDHIGSKYLKGHGAFAFRKADADFAAEFNKYLVPFLGSKEHLEITAKYGFTKAELPEKKTEELCK